MNNQGEIKYKENKKTYTWTRTVDRQGHVEYVSGKQRKSRVEMIQLLGRGNEAGNIPNDFDWTTIGTGGKPKFEAGKIYNRGGKKYKYLGKGKGFEPV